MALDNEMMQGVAAIYKFVYENPGVHRNIIRKKMLSKGKISSKEKFSKTFESLIALGKLTMDKEQVYFKSDFLCLGVLQKERDNAYIVTPNSKKHYKVSKSVAAGYKSGDLLDVVIEHSGKESTVMILGRSKRELSPNEIIRKEKSPSSDPVKVENEKITTLANNPNMVLGRVVKISHDELVFIPNKKSFSSRRIPILNNKEEISKFQDRICVMNVLNPEIPLNGGYIVDVKGEAGNPIHEYDAIAESYGAVTSWAGENLQKEIEALPTKVVVDESQLITEEQAKTQQRGKIVDLRGQLLMTVDPKYAQDMDDAIGATIDKDGNTVIYAAIANVTKYFKLDSEIGQKYTNAAFTFYAPNKAYNILPSKLSTGICSLNPNEDRLAFVVKTVLDSKTGEVKESSIYDAIVSSRAKYSYEEAQEIVDRLDCDGAREYLELKISQGETLTNEEQILMNYYAAQTINKGFEDRRMIRFNSNKEREIQFDSALEEVVDIKPIQHLRYHEVIEEFMITANEAAAKYARDNHLNNIYRVHAEPNSKKLDRAQEFFEIMGIEFDGDLSAQGTINLIELIRNTANEEIINDFLIKMQSRAVYSDSLHPIKGKEEISDLDEEMVSHYALQSLHYSHTTAPIRRVVDYITQYNILAHIHGTEPIPKETILKIVENANEMQIQVDQAEKDFQDISSVFYCEKHIGETFRGQISKFRTASLDEGYEDEIVVIVKDKERGINAEIPLSQILGRPTYDCSISRERCAIYDGRGNVILSICKPIDFIVERADRKTMTVVGKTNKALVKNAEIRASGSQNAHYYHSANGYVNNKRKSKRYKRIKENSKHNSRNEHLEDAEYDK